ncbi:MAG: FeoA family protein [Sphaerochaetaceae bacterium]|jgi:ferrous iron transport protein A|nr:FeoA family protein [Sphaerochaetaceae bacterium]MDD3162602.1 FeoA family protein [Sphaerochaetaceae bacterium]MDD4006521.1 FeoA family protein [Sphaerochaetaceae bacterium]MDD4395942.1 FeoA family protein [Sphaerochaetaceae bacterium]
MKLSELPVGKEAVITKVGGKDEFRLRLLDMGLLPRTKVIIVKTAPMGDPIELKVRGYALTLRKEDVSEIEVEVQ